MIIGQVCNPLSCITNGILSITKCTSFLMISVYTKSTGLKLSLLQTEAISTQVAAQDTSMLAALTSSSLQMLALQQPRKQI